MWLLKPADARSAAKHGDRGKSCNWQAVPPLCSSKGCNQTECNDKDCVFTAVTMQAIIVW